MRVISGATLMSVLGSAILMRILGRKSIQISASPCGRRPDRHHGRLWRCNARQRNQAPHRRMVMLQAIAFITVVTAYITSSFVERLRHQQSAEARSDAMDGEHRLHARFDELAARLDRTRAHDRRSTRPGPAARLSPQEGATG